MKVFKNKKPRLLRTDVFKMPWGIRPKVDRRDATLVFIPYLEVNTVYKIIKKGLIGKKEERHTNTSYFFGAAYSLENNPSLNVSGLKEISFDRGVVLEQKVDPKEFHSLVNEFKEKSFEEAEKISDRARQAEELLRRQLLAGKRDQLRKEGSKEAQLTIQTATSLFTGAGPEKSPDDWNHLFFEPKQVFYYPYFVSKKLEGAKIGIEAFDGVSGHVDSRASHYLLSHMNKFYDQIWKEPPVQKKLVMKCKVNQSQVEKIVKSEGTVKLESFK